MPRLGTRLGLDYGIMPGEVIPPPPPVDSYILIDDIKLWGVIENGGFSGWSDGQIYGLSLSLEL